MIESKFSKEEKAKLHSRYLPNHTDMPLTSPFGAAISSHHKFNHKKEFQMTPKELEKTYDFAQKIYDKRNAANFFVKGINSIYNYFSSK